MRLVFSLARGFWVGREEDRFVQKSAPAFARAFDSKVRAEATEKKHEARRRTADGSNAGVEANVIQYNHEPEESAGKFRCSAGP